MDIIDAILASLRDQGIELPPDVRRRTWLDARRQFGGERVYLKSLPKAQRAGTLAAAQRQLGTAAVTMKRLAQATGIPIRTVKRLANGR